jgi:hypothetical protein
MAFDPHSQLWPGSKAILLVHGIGDASMGKDGAFPGETVLKILGDDADSIALYRLNYDFINDWLASKVQFESGVRAIKTAVKGQLDDDDSSATIADYIGDVLWPVLSLDLRFAVRDAFIAQLQQIMIDRGESALSRGDDPLDYQLTIIAHSLGCFHTYEGLHAAAREPSHELRPASDLCTFDSVILMASPVQLIRTVAGAIGPIVPERSSLATLADALAIPSETRRGKTELCTKDFISITGTHDPVGGHLLGKKLDWAYMDIPGQHSVIVSQLLLDIDTSAGTANALAKAFAAGGPSIKDPHSWSAYIDAQAKMLRGVLFT